MLVDLKLDEFCAQVADKNPVPGGGSVAALAGAMGCSLVEMFCNVTAGRKKYAHIQAEMEAAALYANQWRSHLLELVDLDSAAFTAVLTANRLEKDDPGREQAVADATLEATLVPERTASSCLAVLEKIPPLAAQGNPNAISDLNVGMELLNTAFHGALANVEINLPWLPEDKARDIRANILDLAARAQKALDAGREEIAAR